MRSISTDILLIILLLTVTDTLKSQDGWPRTIIGADGSSIAISHPQPDSLIDNTLLFHAGFTVVKKGAQSPISGLFYAWAEFNTDRDAGTLSFLTTNISSIRLLTNSDSLPLLRETIQRSLPRIATSLSIHRLITLFTNTPHPRDPSTGLGHQPPRILITTQPAHLIFIDGIPRMRSDRDNALPTIANSPYTIVRSSDNWWYCYGRRQWYIAPTPEGPWQHTTYTAPDLPHIATRINAINDRESGSSDTVRKESLSVPGLLPSTTPAEVLQTSGPAIFTAIPGTHLAYAVNTHDPMLFDSLAHQYELLISGRWFRAASLTGPWSWLPADSLSADFAKIPEESPAARVLPFVPGTPAAREAIIDAAIPQTATIDRRTATTTVTYDDIPHFIPIPNTRLSYASNTASVVIRAKHHFYCVEKGVWFMSQSTAGPWIAATDRPEDIERIPAECPIYYCKYAYIYRFDNNSVFTGYTAGYLQSYVDGNTLVYGTGYHTPPYTGNTVYPRPMTYGFNIRYNILFGWFLGCEDSPEWFNTVTAWGIGDGNGGWFGPKGYRPPYIPETP